MAIRHPIDVVYRHRRVRSPTKLQQELRPRRILHVVGAMARGGIETWLMHALRRADPAQYRTDFLVRATQEQAHDAEIRARGGRVIACTDHHLPWRFARHFAEVLRSHGPYHVVHAHLPYYSGFVLWLAARHGVPVRIIHSHNDLRVADAARSRLWRGYCRLMRASIHRYSTVRLAASEAAAESLFGRCWRRDGRCQILYCGIDLGPFEPAEPPVEVRRAIGLPADALVIGHAGRFVWQKNHAFLLRVAAEAMRREPRTRVLLLGDGPLRAEMEGQAAGLGIADRVMFAGVRDDVPRFMTGAMDVLLFPSYHEGLSVALLEAQAAGLPCVLSDGLTEEGDVVPELISRLPLDAPLEDWARAVLGAAHRPLSRAQALEIMRQSPFNIDRSVPELLRLYDDVPA